MILIIKFGLFNAFLIGVLFLTNTKGNLIANRYYGLLVLAFSFIVLENILIATGEILKFPHLFTVGSIMLMLIPPLSFFLYFSLIHRTYKPKHTWLHYLPFVFILVMLLPTFLLDTDLKQEVISSIYYDGEKLSPKYLVYTAINIIQFFIYNLIVLKDIGKKSTSNKRTIKALWSWSYFLYIIMTILMILYIVVYVLFIFTSSDHTKLIVVFAIAVLVSIHLCSVKLVQNPFFFSSSEAKYDRSTLTVEMRSYLKKGFEIYFKENKPFLNSRIKLSKLAQELNVSPHQLSQFINQEKKMTITELLNQYRIKYSIGLLEENAQMTILAVALDSGFSSQANFIKIFKKVTGNTPSQYRKNKS